jgi:hypothetical protein
MNTSSIFKSFRVFSLLVALCLNSAAFATPTEMAMIVQDSTALRAA